MKNKRNKPTAWKKNQKFGDIKGGRLRYKCKDGIVKRLHSLYPPTGLDEKPIFIIDNPSRNYFFPINKEDIKTTLQLYCEDMPSIITHIWFRKHNPKDNVQSYSVGGGGVTAIVLYPFPQDLTINLGKSKPNLRILKWYADYAIVYKKRDTWIAKFSKKSLHDYYLERLLPYEIFYCMEHLHKLSHSKHKQENFAYSSTYESIKLKNEKERLFSNIK